MKDKTRDLSRARQYEIHILIIENITVVLAHNVNTE